MLRISDLERAIRGLSAHRAPAPRGVNFKEIAALLGVNLPSDFRELADGYPTFEIDDFLRIPLPNPGRERDFVGGIFRELEVLRDLEEAEMSEGYVVHPDPGGLIPWSESLSGDVFYWRVSSMNPDDWPVVVNSRSHEWWEFSGGAVAFLVGLVDGSIERKGLPANVLGSDPKVRVYVT